MSDTYLVHSRSLATALLAGVGLVALACNPVTGAGPGTPPDPAGFLHSDPAQRAAVLTLVAGYPATDNQFNFNGYSNGRLRVTVPAGWRLTVQCQNRGTVANSCAVVAGGRATEPVRPGWSTPAPASGLAPGATAAFELVPEAPAGYRLASLVDGHEASGMWLALTVVTGGTPRIQSD